MEFLVAVGLAVAFAWLIKSIGGRPLDIVISALAELVGGWRPDGWPMGVQEEDRDRPWGRPNPTNNGTTQGQPCLKPPLTRVQPTVARR
jgi:hypothetical protein